ncbi:MAG: GntR family transcriptional regulator [Blastocatellia bacterium]|nr:GntR family transcriptional regulator [Blastocatellia bacterium]
MQSKTGKTAFVKRGIPLYYQLENVLRQKILSGEMAIGEQLPTENELSEQYQISRITVRQALATLVRDGLIERRQGSGTFVKDRSTFQGTLNLTGSLKDLMKMGTDTDVRLLETQIIPAGPKEAGHLKLEPGAEVFQIRRIRTYQGTPYSLVVSSLPMSLGKELSENDFAHGSLLKALEQRFNFRIGEAYQTITADLADSYSAPLLETNVGAPLLAIERKVYTTKRIPVAYVRTLYRSDVYSYTVKLVLEEGGQNRQWSVAE